MPPLEPLPGDWLTLLLVVFMLGARHGLDADHLAAIDGLTRFNARQKPRLARWCGSLFSLGHGLVVVSTALVVGTLARDWAVPAWLQDLGAWISIAVLAGMGAMNLAMGLATRPGEMAQPVGIKGQFLGGLQRTSHPVLIALVGTLFAFSFDTMSQAALFAITGTKFGGAGHALALGLVFTTGMLVMDGINGLWIARLIRRADRTAALASRILCVAVGGLSLAVAGYGVIKYASPAVEAWSQGRELAIGMGSVAVIAVSFLFAIRVAPCEPAQPRRGRRG